MEVYLPLMKSTRTRDTKLASSYVKQHEAEVVDGKLYVAGGNRNGRHLSDFQVFDLAWSTLKQKFDFVGDGGSEDALRACSGHTVIIARGGQPATLVGPRLLMFGGEDTRRRLLNDLHILDLETVVGFNRNHAKWPSTQI
ncbi:Acyl-CoA-binding domain-containing protein 5 [Acorus calamus]|uniref:Acyl-CoA-binding domain-containing protein 5 n=1 Tax=Acorus calamus TaxID=4465 RepID=A0AAV9C249_ACOCL|nr:Acyl-CoA-binding domain-containing protein 5 [Acorus calamus]